MVRLGRLPAFLGLVAMAAATGALLARAGVDWATCLGLPDRPQAFRDHFLDPLTLGLAVLPFLPFAVPLLRPGHLALPARMLAAAVLLFLWLLWMLHDPGALHHCDRKGGSQGMVPVLGVLLALPLSWLFRPRPSRV